MTINIMRGNKIGQQVPALVIRDENGQEMTLEQFRGKWLLLIFHRHLA